MTLDRHWASGNDDLSCGAVKRDASSAISRHDPYGLAEWVVGSDLSKKLIVVFKKGSLMPSQFTDLTTGGADH
jgi:hypothetical protein